MISSLHLTPADENSRDLFNYETTYTFDSDFKESKLGDGDSLYNDFSYDHRFLITGKWYFRAGVEYERYDFGGTDNGLPDHLQAALGHLALEYVVKDFPGISIELDPGVYFQDNVSWECFRYPRESLCDLPLKERQDLCRCRFRLGTVLRIRLSRPVAALSGSLAINCACRRSFPSLR